MKKTVIVILLIVGMGTAWGQRGQWWCGMSKKTGLALCIHLTNTNAELYSPLQTSEPIPVSKWSLEGDKLTLECGSIGLKMNLTRKDSTWQGY